MLAASTTAAAEEIPPYSTSELRNGQITSADFGLDDDAIYYQAGSIAKYACTIALFRLQERGKLRLDRPVGQILPRFDGIPAGRPTLIDFLANRSGFAGVLWDYLDESPNILMSVSQTGEALTKFAPSDLEHEPGTHYSYDLIGWVVVQAAIETASGQPLHKALDTLVFQPAGMSRSEVIFGQPELPVHKASETGLEIPPYLACAGGLYSTPADLIALQRFAHKGGISQTSLKELMIIRTPEENYALGGRFEERDGRLFDWKTGSNGAYKSLTIYDPERDIGFAAMAAQDDWTAIEQARDAWIAKTNSQ